MITEIQITETGDATYPLRLDALFDGTPRTLFGVGVVGCPEGASWYEPGTGMDVTAPSLRNALLLHSEAKLLAQRQADLEALLATSSQATPKP